MPTPVPFVPDPVPITPPTPDPAIGVGLPATELAAPIPDPLATFPPPEAPTPTPVATTPVAASTQLQQLKYQLLHVQTNATIELPLGLSPIHLGKPNDRVPPDIDVSGFPSSEVVSRVHANLIREGDNYYVEDIGSANGTYVNHTVLPKGNRHLLRQGDRIGLGKGDLVSFIFQADPM
jgi:pSer/pThr/pTyr-binding forkhead associated (FHA) protein